MDPLPIVHVSSGVVGDSRDMQYHEENFRDGSV